MNQPKQYILRPVFTDRAGRTVYYMMEMIVVTPENEDEPASLQEGAPVAQVRIKDGDDSNMAIEWLPQPEPAPKQGGFTPGMVTGEGNVEGGGTG